MLVLGTGIDFQFFDHSVTQRAFGQHAFYGFFQSAAGKLVLHFAESTLVDAAGETGVAVVNLIGFLVAGYAHLFGVYDDDVVAGINVRGVFGFVFAAQTVCDFGCDTTPELCLLRQ